MDRNTIKFELVEGKGSLVAKVAVPIGSGAYLKNWLIFGEEDGGLRVGVPENVVFDNPGAYKAWSDRIKQRFEEFCEGGRTGKK